MLPDKTYLSLHSFTTLTALSILVITFSCASPRQWIIQETVTCSPEYSSKRLLLAPSDKCNGIQVELIKDCYEVRTTLNCFSLPLTPKWDTSIEVIFDYGDHFETFIGYVLEGGQRIVLSAEGTNQLIENLSSGQPFSIFVGRYKTDLTPYKFVELYY